MDKERHDRIEAACEQIATELLADRQWHCNWRIEVDDCVFDFEIEGFAKPATPHRLRQIEYMTEAYRKQLVEKLLKEEEATG